MTSLSFSRFAGIAFMAAATAISAGANASSNQKQKEEPKQSPAATAQVEKAPVKVTNDTTPLKLIAEYGQGLNSAKAIATDVVGLDNCIKTAEVFTKLTKASNFYPVNGACLPRDGGHPVLEFKCYETKDNVFSCVPKPS